MWARFCRGSTGPLLITAMFCLRPSPAEAQSVEGSGPLGGYGASSGLAGPGMGGGGPMVIPYGGMTEGFMPGRMGGGSPLRLRERPIAGMGPSRASSGLSTIPGGMGRGPGARTSLVNPMGLRGMGSSGGPSRPRPGMGVIPPVIGYPFRQPPSPSSPASGTPGMPM